MDSFEQVIASLLERDGFWIRSSYKVDLTRSDKILIGRASSPRWEVDLVAYKGKTNELWIVECKSYLDSGGVSISAFDGSNPTFANRFKLFNEKKLLKIVSKRLCEQMVKSGACRSNPKVRLLLAAGKIVGIHRDKLTTLFKRNGWILWDEKELKKRLSSLSGEGYDNTVASVVSKMLLRRRENEEAVTK